MTRIALLAVALAANALAAEPVAPPVPVGEMRPGYGVVESVMPVRLAARERSAAAGGSAASSPATRTAYRITVRMPDGTLQQRDLDQPEFRPGDHVLLTNAGDVLPD